MRACMRACVRAWMLTPAPDAEFRLSKIHNDRNCLSLPRLLRPELVLTVRMYLINLGESCTLSGIIRYAALGLEQTCIVRVLHPQAVYSARSLVGLRLLMMLW